MLSDEIQFWRTWHLLQAIIQKFVSSEEQVSVALPWKTVVLPHILKQGEQPSNPRSLNVKVKPRRISQNQDKLFRINWIEFRQDFWVVWVEEPDWFFYRLEEISKELILTSQGLWASIGGSAFLCGKNPTEEPEDSIVSRVFALHVTDLSSAPSFPYGSARSHLRRMPEVSPEHCHMWTQHQTKYIDLKETHLN